MSNTVKAENNTEVYRDDMFMYADEYISTLHDKDSIYNSTGHTFTGMIKYINRKLFRGKKDIICPENAGNCHEQDCENQSGDKRLD